MDCRERVGGTRKGRAVVNRTPPSSLGGGGSLRSAVARLRDGERKAKARLRLLEQEDLGRVGDAADEALAELLWVARGVAGVVDLEAHEREALPALVGFGERRLVRGAEALKDALDLALEEEHQLRLVVEVVLLLQDLQRCQGAKVEAREGTSEGASEGAR